MSAVLAANLMCRVPDPAKFLADMKDLVVEGGAFVLVSPFSVNSPQNPHRTRIATFSEGALIAPRRLQTLGHGPQSSGPSFKPRAQIF
jgi:hypothetical protein